MRKLTFACMLLLASSLGAANYKIISPDGLLQADVKVGNNLTYTVSLKDKKVIVDSPISMSLSNGAVWGKNPEVTKVSQKKVDTKIASPFYRADSIRENYASTIIDFKGGWSVEFRAYNDGIAYRLVSRQKRPLIVAEEEVAYYFPEDATAYVPYAKARKDDPFFNSFENEYAAVKVSDVDKDKLIFLPIAIDLGDGTKVVVTESDLEQYPGLYLSGNGSGFKGVHAKYPKTQTQGGHNNLQMIVGEREDFIAHTDGTRKFPWRVVIVADEDTQLAESNLSYLLASPSRVADISWIKPGKVAWDWWNNWNLTGVDFETGVNNDTYRAYIDFASRNGIEYVILDEGWAVNKQADLFQIVPEIDLEELIKYAEERNVGIVLWAGYKAFDRDMEKVCRYYSEKGVKGFKVDFMDRDDQEVVDFVHRAARTAAKYNLFLDLHGMYKPAGLNRTYPHILNFEGVNGLEQMKWSGIDLDQMEYDVMIPFIRQVSGPMDYTPGAMKNGTKKSYHSSNTEPMSQGTRAHQLALFVAYDSPFTMLCDTPSNYDHEPECRDFIASVPTVWDETKVLSGKMGEYYIVARRKGDKWYVAGLTDWNPREIDLDLSFLPEGIKRGVMIRDGVNAGRNANDYKKETVSVDPTTPLKVKLAPGGGFVMEIEK